MACKDCSCYQSMFNLKHAKRQLRKYKKKGLRKPTFYLVETLKQHKLAELSLLDIGGGIGTIPFELMEVGVKQVTNVDISRGYQKVFSDELKERGLEEKVKIFNGDFVDIAPQLEQVDIVTLDKVICCYPDFEDLINLSLEKSRKYYAYILPKDVWWMRLGKKLVSFIRLFKKDLIEVFVHPPLVIEDMVQKAGFKKLEHFYHREWQVLVFAR